MSSYSTGRRGHKADTSALLVHDVNVVRVAVRRGGVTLTQYVEVGAGYAEPTTQRVAEAVTSLRAALEAAGITERPAKGDR